MSQFNTFNPFDHVPVFRKATKFVRATTPEGTAVYFPTGPSDIYTKLFVQERVQQYLDSQFEEVCKLSLPSLPAISVDVAAKGGDKTLTVIIRRDKDGE